jgi:EmrB/QacA subfamily drug resistance transporter
VAESRASLSLVGVTSENDEISRRRRLAILAVCGMSLFIVSLDNTIVNVALPSIQSSLHAEVSGLQWVIDAYVLVLASLLMLFGSMGDRIGHLKVFNIGLVIFVLGSLACSLAPNLPALVGFRMLQGIGGSMLNPNSLSLITSVFTDARERAMAYGVWGGIFGVSAAAGPILGGGLVDSVGWRSIFWVNIPIGIAAFVLSRWLVPESKSEHPRPIDVPGQILVIATLATATYAIIEGPTAGWTSTRILGLGAVAVVMLVGFVVVELRVPHPLVDLGFFRSPPFTGAVSIATLAFFVLAGFLFLNTLYLQEVRGDTAFEAGLATLPATAIVAVTAPLAGRLVGRSGIRMPLIGAGLLMFAGTLVLAMSTRTTGYGVLAIGYALLGLGFGLVNPPITNAAISGMPASRSGTAAAIASTSRQTGSVMGVAITGSLAAERFGHLAPGGRGGSGLSLPAGSGAVVRNAFALATHPGWFVMAGCSVAISVVALLTTGPRGLQRAAEIREVIDRANEPEPVAISPA